MTAIGVWIATVAGAIAKAAGGGPPAPAAPLHTFSIRVGGRGSTRGYNAPGNFGSIEAESSANYRTLGGKDVSVIHARRLGNEELVFGLRGAAAVAADFPREIVATKTTGGESVVACVPKVPDDIAAVAGGVRRDYRVSAGSLTDVFIQNQTVRVELFY